MLKMGGGGGGKGRGGGRVQERLSYGGDTWFHLTSLGENGVKFKGSSRVGLPWCGAWRHIHEKILCSVPEAVDSLAIFKKTDPA